MGSVGTIALAVLAFLIVVPLGIAGVVFLVVPTAKGIAWLFRQVFRFIGAEIGDLLRLIGAIITSLVLVPITLVNVLFGRWSSAAHYGRAIEGEGKAIGGCVYRMAIGHPARLLCLTPLTEGIEQRVPQAFAAAPGPDRPAKRTGQFDGFTIVGSLPGGGSGSKLYIADPSAQKLAAFARNGQTGVGRVVIKSFSLNDGSTLPQIVRENRALPAAKRLGLILEHELHEDRFFYVTRYVPGESLGIAAQRLHALCGGAGLSGTHLREAIEYAADVVRTLQTYHAGGLWHKDVKPDNIIVSDGRAHLVDFGLVTPLRSSMTLTTHGTEYFRDPEMVRMALRGVKVHEVDGAKFDIYAAGAVLYAVIENSFPAHGGLSQISRSCPEVVRWIVRRAMTDYDKRYESATVMLADLVTVLSVPDPFALKPVDLPSVRGDDISMPPPLSIEESANAPDINETAAGRVGPAVTPVAFGAAGTAGNGGGGEVGNSGFFESIGRKVDGTMNAAGFSPRAGSAVPPVGSPARSAPRVPNVRVSSWLTGKYEVWDAPPQASVQPPHDFVGVSAAVDLGRARDAARQAREHARERAAARDKNPAGVNAGVGAAFAMFLLVGFGIIAAIHAGGVGLGMLSGRGDTGNEQAIVAPPAVPVVVSTDGRADADADTERPASTRGSSRRANGKGSSTKTVADPAVLAAPAGQVLVLKDSMTFDASAQQAVESQMHALEGAGFTLRGSTLRVPAGEDELRTETDLAASLKAAIGMEAFGSQSAAELVRSWLDDHPEIAMIAWFGRTDAGKPQAWLVTRSGLPASTGKQASNAMSNADAAPRK